MKRCQKQFLCHAVTLIFIEITAGRQTRMNGTDLRTYIIINKKENNMKVSVGLVDCEIGMINKVIERKPMTEQKER